MKKRFLKKTRGVFWTPENIGGPCMIGKPWSKEESKEVEEFVEKHKLTMNAKASKPVTGTAG